VRSRIRIRGGDSVDLLHRLSATRLDDIGLGDARAALFTDDKGKVVDLTLCVGRRDGVDLLAGRPDQLTAWLERFVFTEDVEIGKPAKIGVIDWLAGDEPEGWAAASTPLALGARSILLGEDAAALANLADRAQASGARRLDESARRIWLFERCVLAPGDGLDDRLNALEAGLRAFVDFEKGCYIGQEVIARLENYDKLRRSLATLCCNGWRPSRGDELRTDSGSLARVLEIDGVDEDCALALLLADRSIEDGTELRASNEDAGKLAWPPASTNALKRG